MSVWMPLFQTKFNSVRDRYCTYTFCCGRVNAALNCNRAPPLSPLELGQKYFGEKFVAFATSKISNFQEICMTTTIKFCKLYAQKITKKQVRPFNVLSERALTIIFFPPPDRFGCITFIGSTPAPPAIRTYQ